MEDRHFDRGDMLIHPLGPLFGRESDEDDSGDSGSNGDGLASDAEVWSALVLILGTLLVVVVLLTVLWCVCKKCFGCQVTYGSPSSAVTRSDGYELGTSSLAVVCDSQPTAWKASAPHRDLEALGLSDGVFTNPAFLQPSPLEDRYVYDGKLGGGASFISPIGDDSVSAPHRDGADNDFREDRDLRELCRVGMTKNETVSVDGKLVVFIAREVSHLGDTLVLSEMGISLTVPPYAVDVGRTQLVTLILDWDLSDFPAMAVSQAIVSPVVHCGPHGLRLNRPAVLSYRHCAYDTGTVSLVASQTHLMQPKEWRAVGEPEGRGASPGPSCTLSVNEVQVRLTHFTLYTCLSQGQPGAEVKKWMQLAVFGGRMRPRHRYEIRLYFLNNTPCALQFALQNESRSHFKLLCPPREFLVRGEAGRDLQASVRHVNEGWSQRLDDRQERVPFASLWHGKCPSVSFIFRHENERVRELDARLEVSQQSVDGLASGAETTTLKVLASMRASAARRGTKAAERRSGSNRAVINVYPAGRRKRERCGSESSLSCSSNSLRSAASLEASDASSSSETPSSSSSTSTPSSSNSSSAVNTDTDSHCEATGGKATGGACTQTMQIHIHPSSDSTSRTDLDKHLPRRIIPHKLSMELVPLLDPLCSLGKDWRLLASALDMDSLIPLLKNTPAYNPTQTLLEEVERQCKSLEWLASVLMKAKRLDAANVIMKYADKENSTSCVERES